MNNFDKNFLSRQVQKLELISELSTLKMLQWPLQPKTDFRPDDYIREDIVQIFKDHKLPTFLFNLIPFFFGKNFEIYEKILFEFKSYLVPDH